MLARRRSTPEGQARQAREGRLARVGDICCGGVWTSLCAKMAAEDAKKKEKESLGVILKKAGKRALGGGLPGFVAMLIQVVALMWMRTLVNYQYSRGGSFTQAFRKLYDEGGIGRFYSVRRTQAALFLAHCSTRRRAFAALTLGNTNTACKPPALTGSGTIWRAGILGSSFRRPALALRRHRRECRYSCRVRWRASGWHLDDVGFCRRRGVAHPDTASPKSEDPDASRGRGRRRSYDV